MKISRVFSPFLSRKAGLWMIAISGGLVLTVSILVNVFLNPYVKERLIETVHNSSKGVYRLDIHSLDISLLSGSVTAEGIVLHHDSLQWQKNRNAIPIPMQINMEIHKISISGMNLWKYWRSRELIIGKLIIQKADINLFVLKDTVDQSDRVEDTISKTTLKRLPRIIAPLADKIEIGKLQVQQTALRYEGASPQGNVFQQADSIHLEIENLRLDRNTADTDTRVLYSDRVQLSFRNYHVRFPNGIYELAIATFDLTSADSLIRLKNLRFSPVIPDAVFVKRHPYRTSRYKTTISEILAKPDLYRLFHQNEWRIDNLVADRLLLDIFIDKKLPAEPNQQKKMPHEALQRLPFPVQIDRIHIKNSHLAYSQLSPEGTAPGTVKFSDTDLKIYRLSNRADAKPAELILSSRLMGAGLLRLHLLYRLTSPVFNCQYSGSLGKMEAAHLNTIFTPDKHFRLEEGYIEKVNFEVRVRNGHASGALRAVYRDLKVSLLDKETKKKKKLLSKIANLVLRNDNHPDDNKPMETGDISYSRNPQDSFMRFLWRSVKTGLVATLMPGEKAKMDKEE